MRVKCIDASDCTGIYVGHVYDATEPTSRYDSEYNFGDSWDIDGSRYLKERFEAVKTMKVQCVDAGTCCHIENGRVYDAEVPDAGYGKYDQEMCFVVDGHLYLKDRFVEVSAEDTFIFPPPPETVAEPPMKKKMTKIKVLTTKKYRVSLTEKEMQALRELLAMTVGLDDSGLRDLYDALMTLY